MFKNPLHCAAAEIIQMAADFGKYLHNREHPVAVTAEGTREVCDGGERKETPRSLA